MIKTWLVGVNPIVDPAIAPDGTFSFENAAVAAGVATPPEAYVIGWSRFDNAAGTVSGAPIEIRSAGERSQVPQALVGGDGYHRGRDPDHPRGASGVGGAGARLLPPDRLGLAGRRPGTRRGRRVSVSSVRVPAYADIEEAAKRLDGVASRTPVVTSRSLDDRTGARVLFKCENLQRAGAFKFRGAYNAIARLTGDERRRGVVAFSSGNHAQAVALASRLLGAPAVLVMPADAPAVKRAATEGYGALIVSYDRSA